MNNVGRAQVDQWYLRQDKGEAFLVTAVDDKARTIEIQTFDGDVDEIEADAWDNLPLELAAPPENCTGPIDDVEVDDLGYTDTEMSETDWNAPLQPLAPAAEAWEDRTDEAERDAEEEGTPEEELALDNPTAKDQLL